jgi:hypothetical protein
MAMNWTAMNHKLAPAARTASITNKVMIQRLARGA